MAARTGIGRVCPTLSRLCTIVVDMEDTRMHQPASRRRASTGGGGTAGLPGATVVQIETYRIRRTTRVRALPLFDGQDTAEDGGPIEAPAPPARALTERDVAHRQRMLRHLLGR